MSGNHQVSLDSRGLGLRLRVFSAFSEGRGSLGFKDVMLKVSGSGFWGLSWRRTFRASWKPPKVKLEAQHAFYQANPNCSHLLGWAPKTDEPDAGGGCQPWALNPMSPKKRVPQDEDAGAGFRAQGFGR